MSEYIDDLNAEILLELTPEELAPILLRTALRDKQNNMIHIQSSTYLVNKPQFSSKRDEIIRALNESWSWLIANLYIVPDPGINAQGGFKILSRKGEKFLKEPDTVTDFGTTENFPKHLLHSSIPEEVYRLYVRGKFDDAVLKSFLAVEEAVRHKSGLTADDYGVKLMRKAFDKKNGPLSDKKATDTERTALAELFASSIGVFKNPHSHRTVKVNESEAIDRILLASHLLRIVDTRPIKPLGVTP